MVTPSVVLDATPRSPAFPAARVVPSRVDAMLTRLATISEPGPGVTRLAYTELEREAHALFAGWMAEIGLDVHVDAAGNTIAERPGENPALPAIGTGSHLDSVPQAGGYDGIVGVVAAVEVARALAAEKTRVRHPLRFVAFAAEEGARFGQACTGSRLAAGLCTMDDLRRCRDKNGVSLAEAMASVGFDPQRAVASGWRPAEWAAFVELHIEQGTVLEVEHADIGVVELISGSTRLRLDIEGRASHTGGSPMSQRFDALAAAAEVVLLVERIAKDSRHHGTRATVGLLNVWPGSITTIPGRVDLTVDVRDVDADRQRETAVEIVQSATLACERRGVAIVPEVMADASPVILPAWLRRELIAAAAEFDVDCRSLPSGASHDAQMINTVIPTGMLFVPSRNGISHAPDESTSADQIATGARVLGGAMLRLDALPAPTGPTAVSAA